jgi:hypothetical protein
LRSVSRPAIHIVPGENVCIHATTPTQRASALADSHSASIASGPVTTGLVTTGTGMLAAASRPAPILAACSLTW